MESSPPYPIEPGERVLAAIVFTDVVNFSARVQEDEVATLGLLDQDVATMTKYCERYSGWVLKSTGDGLLLYFSSAVHAVNCALQIQHFFAKRAQSQPSSQNLVHRIGVHLGDVFLKDQDVMGDGVNIASRLQSVADPGGICISQTVYDVVKNKLELDVERLAPRELKNISEIGAAMYRVLLEARKAAPAPAPAPFRPLDRPARKVFSRTEKFLAVGLLLLALAAVARLIFQADSSQKAALAESEATKAALTALLKDKPAVATEPAAETTPASLAPAKPAEINFADFAANPSASQGRSAAEIAAIRTQAADSVQALVPWVKTAMERYTKDAPLLVPRLSANMPAEFKVFTDADQRFVFATGGAARARAWDELKLADQEALIVGTLVSSLSPPPAEVMRGADAFAYLHDLPEMIPALHPPVK